MAGFIPGSYTSDGKLIVSQTKRYYGWWQMFTNKAFDDEGNEVSLTFTQSETKTVRLTLTDDVLLFGGRISSSGLTSFARLTVSAIIPPSEYTEVTDNSGDVDLVDLGNGTHMIIPAQGTQYKLTKAVPLDQENGGWDWHYDDVTKKLVVEPCVDEEGLCGGYGLFDFGVKIGPIVDDVVFNNIVDIIPQDAMYFSKHYKLEISVDFGSNTSGEVNLTLVVFTPSIPVTGIG